MKYVAKFDCGFAGAEDVHFLIADNDEQVQEYMMEGLPEYVSSYSYLAQGYWDDEDKDEEDWYDSQEYEDFANDCYFDFWEVTEDDVDNYGVTDNDWVDIR